MSRGERSRTVTAVVIWVLAAGWAHARSEPESVPVVLKGPEDNRICLGCHGSGGLKKVLPTGEVISLYVEGEALKGSVHAERTCAECHADIREVPHRKPIEKVNCERCHYVTTVNRVAPQREAAAYEQSVHREALARGQRNAPTCQDCHGSHEILGPKNPRSPVSKRAIPKTCGRCHLEIYSDYRESVHGRALMAGNCDVPVCTDCHGEHSIRSPSNPASQVYATQVSETCSKCHGLERIERKYRLAAQRAESYRESYHGLASRFGSPVVANCASCHMAHNIRPSSDPRSSVNKANLPATCGKCHRGANENFARGKVHVIITKRGEKLLYWVSSGFKWLTLLVMAGLIGHISLDLLGRWRAKRKQLSGGGVKT